MAPKKLVFSLENFNLNLFCPKFSFKHGWTWSTCTRPPTYIWRFPAPFIKWYDKGLLLLCASGPGCGYTDTELCRIHTQYQLVLQLTNWLKFIDIFSICIMKHEKHFDLIYGLSYPQNSGTPYRVHSLKSRGRSSLSQAVGELQATFKRCYNWSHSPSLLLRPKRRKASVCDMQAAITRSSRYIDGHLLFSFSMLACQQLVWSILSPCVWCMNGHVIAVKRMIGSTMLLFTPCSFDALRSSHLLRGYASVFPTLGCYKRGSRANADTHIHGLAYSARGEAEREKESSLICIVKIIVASAEMSVSDHVLYPKGKKHRI